MEEPVNRRGAWLLATGTSSQTSQVVLWVLQVHRTLITPADIHKSTEMTNWVQVMWKSQVEVLVQPDQPLISPPMPHPHTEPSLSASRSKRTSMHGNWLQPRDLRPDGTASGPWLACESGGRHDT
ncbi:hypothetical protein RRG08_025069 [Elysia crispata]|uniref:Uncharacterized protein n=1 Tax=Elysia crispata TaxID=231223 RepID=A0AAE1DZS6_9GAST|nr:hypothetical protein RRG08_025069 [Elysia crispata]